MEQSLSKNDTQPKDGVYEPTTFVNYEDMSFEFGKSGNVSVFMNKYEQSLKKFKEENNDGKNDEKIAICYNNIASVLLNQTKYQQSLDRYNEALSICLKLDPNSENLNMAAIYHNIGWLNVERGSSRDALKFTEKAIRIRTKLLDLNHPDVAISYNNQSVIYLSQGKISQAMKVCAKVLEIRKALYPDENSPFLAESYINRGVILENMGELEEALESANKAVEIYIKLYGENFRELATIENNKGNLNSHLGREVEALGNFFKGLKIYRNLNSRNYLMSTILDNLACLFEKKRFSLANLKEVLTKSHQLRLHFVGKGEYDTRNLWRKVYFVDMKKSLLEVEAST